MGNFSITKETASRALFFIDRGDTPGQAAYDLELTLTSIAPYTDKRTTATLRLFHWLERRPAEKLDSDIATIRRIATGDPGHTS
jgi:hypothetical protein